MVAVVCLYAMVRLSGPGEDTVGVVFREGEGAPRWGGAATVKATEVLRREVTVLVLTIGNAADAIRATTQTACRWLAGPWRSSQAAKAATPAMTGICQRELSRNVKRYQLIVSMFIFLSFLGPGVFGFG